MTTKRYAISPTTDPLKIKSLINDFKEELRNIEEATGTVNDVEVYEMEGLDIRNFIGTVLHWSNVIEVLDQDEYREIYT